MSDARPQRILPAAALAALLLAPLGCSISHSSRSLSDSASSPFQSSSDSVSSSSDSSPEAQEDHGYQDEIASYTAGHVGSGADATAFRRGIASIAQRRGIADWEDDEPTCRAIGAGLHRAGLSRAAAEAQAETLLAGRADRVSVVMKGYDAAP